MKNCRIALLSVLAFTLLSSSCSWFQGKKNARITATLSLDSALTQSKDLDPATQSSANPILPGENWSPYRYQLSGLGPNGASFNLEAENGVFSTECLPGEWVLNAQAFSLENKEIASGSCTCLLQPGKTSAAEITLYLLEGNGVLSVYLTKNLQMPPDSRIVGQLAFKGLPGRPLPASPQSIPIDLPASESELFFPELPAGYYLLNLELKTAEGFVSGGCAISALVLSGFTSSGSCVISMGMPIAGAELNFYPNTPLDSAILSVEHLVARGASALPMAVSITNPGPGEEILRTWHRNGSESGNAAHVISASSFIPEAAFIFPPSCPDAETSMCRFDYSEESLTSHRRGAATLFLGNCNAADALPWKLKAVYNYRAALAPSLCRGGAANQGSGTLKRVRSIAASPSGLVIASDLDEDAALHAFAAPYGASLDGVPGFQTVPSDASWLRLWRDRIQAGGYKSADRLAVSNDGRLLAAAASAGSWLWLGWLNEEGKLAYSSYLTKTNDGSALDGLSYIKALEFSAAGDRLYAISSSAKTVFSFSTASGNLQLLSSLQLSEKNSVRPVPADICRTASGVLAVSATDANRIYLLHDGGSLQELGYIEGSSQGPGPYKPGAIVASLARDGFYALCNEEKIECFSRPIPEAVYSLSVSLGLAPESEGASLLAIGCGPAGGAETLLVAGSSALEFIGIESDGSPEPGIILQPPAGDPQGWEEPTAIDSVKGAFLIAGGDTGTISVFGSD